MSDRVIRSASRRESSRRRLTLRLLTLLALVPAATLARIGATQASPLASHADTLPPGVVCREAGDQTAPRLVADGQRGAIVAWVDGREGASAIYAQHLLASLAPDPRWPSGGLAVCGAAGTRSHLRMIGDGAGGAIVTWEDSRAGNADVYAQHVLAGGVLDPGWPADGLPLAVHEWNERAPELDGDGHAGAIVAWQDERAGESWPFEVRVQHVRAPGAVDPRWPAEGAVIPDAQAPRPVADGQRGAVVVFVHTSMSGWGTLARRVTAAGDLDPTWPEPGARAGFGGAFDAASDAAGGVYVICSQGDYSFAHVLASGVTSDSSFRYCLHCSYLPGALAADGQGGVAGVYAQASYRSDLLTYTDFGVFVQSASGGRVGWGLPWQPSRMIEYAIAPDAAGGALATWTDNRRGGAEIFIQHVLAAGGADPACPPEGRPLSDWRRGVAAASQIVSDDRGGAIVAWQGVGPDGSWDILVAGIPWDAPTAVEASLVSAEADADHARLEWSLAGGSGPTVRVYRREEQTAWRLLGTVPVDGTGRVVFVDREVASGERHGYRLGIGADGREVAAGETWLVIPAAPEFALRGLQPNPAGATPIVAFSLPGEGPAALELFDVDGRRVARQEVGGLGAGVHLVRLDGGARVPAGLYLIRLSQAGRVRTLRGVIVR